MRSEQVFRAAQQVENRYALCLLTAKATRRLNFVCSSVQDAIQDAFVMVCVTPNLAAPLLAERPMGADFAVHSAIAVDQRVLRDHGFHPVQDTV